jgi:hypothetical protein
VRQRLRRGLRLLRRRLPGPAERSSPLRRMQPGVRRRTDLLRRHVCRHDVEHRSLRHLRQRLRLGTELLRWRLLRPGHRRRPLRKLHPQLCLGPRGLLPRGLSSTLARLLSAHARRALGWCRWCLLG